MRRSPIAAACVAVIALVTSTTAVGEPRQSDGTVAKIEDLACRVDQKSGRRKAHYVVYGNGKEHLGFEGPEMLSPQEAAFKKKHLEAVAKQKYGAEAKVNYGVVDSNSCSFIYSSVKGGKYSLAQGPADYLADRRNGMLKTMKILSPTVCLTDKVEMPTVLVGPGFSAMAHGTQRETTCAAAEKCMRADAATLSYAPKGPISCDCEKTSGEMLSCTAKGHFGKDSLIGIRG